MSINAKQCLTHGAMISRNEYRCLRYNSQVVGLENCSVVVVSNGVIRRLRALDDGIINPKKLNLFQGKVDRTNHVLYFIDGCYHDMRWGGNVQYEDKKAGNIQEGVFLRASLTYRIDRGERFLPLLSETRKTYDDKFVEGKIRGKIDNTIKQCVLRSLLKKGFIGTQACVKDLAHEIQDELNEEVLASYGVSLLDFCLYLEEDNGHAARRNRFEWQRFEAKKGEY